MLRHLLAALACTTVFALTAAHAQPATRPAKTFCNPLDLDYGLREAKGELYRHGADPVIVLYHDRYYLFSTWDRPGYRVSDDLVTWRFIPFATPVGVAGDGTYTAAAVAEREGWLYFTEFGTAKRVVALYRTKDPDSGRWKKVVDALPPYADPCLFVDPRSQRVFMYFGLERPMRGVELDPKTFAELPGTATQLMEPIVTKPRIRDGWEVCTWDHSEQSPGMRGNKTFLPCREGSWMTEHNGTYYLQYASPGTSVPGYADGVLTSDSPLGSFTCSPFSPISQKDSGFTTSAGHGCLFQDRHGNWWRAATMLIGVHHAFERRIGLFPAGFDRDGVPFTRTDLGEAPIVVPDKARAPDGGAYDSGWRVISDGATATSSSSLDATHSPDRAADEDIRTCWSARTGDAGEWLRLDLGEVRTIEAVQVNLFEQNVPKPTTRNVSEDADRYTLAVSEDGGSWTTIIDRSASTSPSPHHYTQLERPMAARYLKLENVQSAGGGKFAVSDLRAFGHADGPAPAAVVAARIERDPNDRRKVTLQWKAAAGATGYVVRYGIEPNKLYRNTSSAGVTARRSRSTA